MANKTYPILSTRTWWQLRNRFKQSIPTTVSKNYLSTVLNIQEKAAANILPSLKVIGLIDSEGKPTDLANHWRVDTEYKGVCQEIKQNVYSEELTSAVPNPENDRDAASRWFMREASVGSSTASMMASLYILLSKADYGEGNSTNSNKPSTTRIQKDRKTTKVTNEPAPVADPPKQEFGDGSKDSSKSSDSFSPSVHIDIQIHISPESTAEQIDQIFASMAKHLNKPKGS